ncbi:MAG: MBOAT family protein [Deltaproteobacteria bacterium]|nr:MBOAT family protein [Deltaproteobacteria bacterium]
MLFNTPEFLLFFPIVAGLFFLLRQRFRWAWLLAASYFFYACWRPSYLILILVSTLVDYFCGLGMEATSSRTRQRLLVGISIVVNLGFLAAFKYLDFFFSIYWDTAELFGWSPTRSVIELVLPVGISFYTFQTMSYSLDVFGGRRKAERHLGYFALYVAFFPQLVAGPIERSTRLLPQLRAEHRLVARRVWSGLQLILGGLFKKVVIADTLAKVVDPVFASPQGQMGPAIALATIFFSLQIYCDFSGYSDIAIGVARVMGFDLMKNFERPYLAISIADFWRRWHISLSTWFRDYLYFPLGGSRVRPFRQGLNLVVVFAVSGLWHGANWTFIIWGLLHGSYMVVSLLTKSLRLKVLEGMGISPESSLLLWFRRATVFSLVCLAWIFFRARSLADAVYLIRHIPFGWPQLGQVAGLQAAFQAPLAEPVVLGALLCLGLLAAHLLGGQEEIWERLSRQPRFYRWSVYYGLIAAVAIWGNAGGKEFIYFQF